ncbi:MAG: PEP-CTERM sorting domain-containing protein [Planctomycetaceae bacterium]
MARYVLPVVLLILGGIAHADTLSIADGGATFEYRSDDAAGTGNADLTLDGVDLSFDESWFLQLAGGTEELLAGTFTDFGPGFGSLLFTDASGDLELEVIYGITDLSGALILDFEAILTNFGTDTISGELVNYLDFDLPDGGADEGFFDDFGVGDDVFVTVDDTAGGPTGHFADRLFEEADGAEIDEFDSLLTRVKAGTTLGRTDNGFLDGNFTAAGGWSFELAGGEDVAFFGSTLAAAAVPEPSSFFAFTVAALGLLFRRRRNSLFA